MPARRRQSVAKRDGNAGTRSLLSSQKTRTESAALTAHAISAAILHRPSISLRLPASVSNARLHLLSREAAKAIGVSPTTLLKWMKITEFDQAYRAARRDAFRQSVARLQQASRAAVTTLLKIMVDSNSPASTRLRAADIVLAHTSKAIEIEDVEARVAALEAAAATGGQR